MYPDKLVELLWDIAEHLMFAVVMSKYLGIGQTMRSQAVISGAAILGVAGIILFRLISSLIINRL